MRKELEILTLPFNEQERNVELPSDVRFLYLDRDENNIKIYYAHSSKSKNVHNIQVCKPSPKMVMLADNDFNFVGSIEHLSIFSKTIS